ncbi:MAG: branched-chain amino acid ABC transporter substrate-binding protein [Burkholderiales bacterium]
MRFMHVVLATLFACFAASASAQDKVRIAYIEGLSGPFANVGEFGLRHLQLAIETINARGGTQFEAIPFDSKTSPQEALLAFRQVVDRRIGYIMQGNGSSVALALTEAVAKHNRRNPSRPVVFLNYAAVDPALTGEKCNFWHFRFDADSDMKMQALTSYMAGRKNIKKVYLINQDYSFGHAVAKAAREMLGKKRPDVEIVGDDLHPLGRIRDFAPYIAKIRSSGADSVITGNWGNDLALLVKAGRDAGLLVDYYTYYGGALTAPTILGESGIDHVKQVTTWHANIGGKAVEESVLAYRARYPDVREDLYFSSIRIAVEMLAAAIARTGSPDPREVAFALEDMRMEDHSGEVWIRKDDHQLVQPLFVSTLVKADGRNVKFDVERSGLGFRTDARIAAKDTVLPSACRMQRPR